MDKRFEYEEILVNIQLFEYSKLALAPCVSAMCLRGGRNMQVPPMARFAALLVVTSLMTSQLTSSALRVPKNIRRQVESSRREFDVFMLPYVLVSFTASFKFAAFYIYSAYTIDLIERKN